MGLYSLPPQYYISLFAVEASYLGLMTVAEKNLHKEKQGFVLKRGKATVMKKKIDYITISSGLAGFLIKSLNSDEFKSTGLGNEESELKTLKYSVKKEKL